MIDQPSLDEPLARIDRADELTLQLTAACKALPATPPYTIEERADENPTTRAFVETALQDVPFLPRLGLSADATNRRHRREATEEVGVSGAGQGPDDTAGRERVLRAIKKTISPLPAPLRARIEDLQPANTNHEWPQIFTSWNRLVSWLHQAERLPAAA